MGKVEKAEPAWEAAQNALTAARGRSEQLGSQAEAARTMIKSLETRLADLTGDGKIG